MFDNLLSKPYGAKIYAIIFMSLNLLIYFRIINPTLLNYSLKTTIFQGNIWRIFTSIFLMSSFRVSLLLNFCIFIYALHKIEQLLFRNNQYVNFIWLNMLILLGGFFFVTLNEYTNDRSFTEINIISDCYQSAIQYIWCKNFLPAEVPLMFEYTVSRNKLPIYYGLVMMFYGDYPNIRIIGIILGQCYVFTQNHFYQKKYLSAPQWLQNIIKPCKRVIGHFGGQGVRLA